MVMNYTLFHVYTGDSIAKWCSPGKLDRITLILLFDASKCKSWGFPCKTTGVNGLSWPLKTYCLLNILLSEKM